MNRVEDLKHLRVCDFIITSFSFSHMIIALSFLRFAREASVFREESEGIIQCTVYSVLREVRKVVE